MSDARLNNRGESVMSEKIIGAVASALRLDATELSVLKDGENWLSEEEIAEKLPAVILEKVKAAKDAQLKRGTRESWAAVEKWMKSQGYEPDAELKGQDLLDAFAEYTKAAVARTKVDGEGAKTLTPEELAALPDVKTLISKRVNEALTKLETDAKAEAERVKAEFSAYKQKAESERTTSVARAFVTRALEDGDVLLEPKGATVNKERRIEAVLREIDLNRVRVSEKGTPYLVDANGDAEEDEYGRPIDLAKQVIGIGVELYGKRGQDPGKGGGEPSQGGGQAGNGKYVPKYGFANEAEFSSAIMSETDAAKRAQMMQDYNHVQQKKGAAGNAGAN